MSAELGHGAALTEGDDLIAGDLICIADNRAYFLTGGYEPDFQRFSPGMITLSHAIEACRRRGILDFNLLWGDGVYKQRLGGRCQPLVTILSRRSPATLLRPAYLAALSRFGWLHLKRALKPMLARLKGLAPEKPSADAKGDLPSASG
ncbi:MAG: GNAT family N-acetyltransferase [Microvirga sp.]